MPRRIARIQYLPGFKEPQVLTDGQWTTLETALGRPIPERIRLKMTPIIAGMSMRAPNEQSALPVVQARKMIKAFEKKAQGLRNSIWYGPDENVHALFGESVREFNEQPSFPLTAVDIEARYFRTQGRVLDDSDDSVLPLLVHALDAVVATCKLAFTKLNDPDHRVDDGFFITVIAVALRRICKKNDLPFKIRKDADIIDDGQHSPFIRFFNSLIKILELPAVSKEALATRILRLEKRLKKRGQKKDLQTPQ